MSNQHLAKLTVAAVIALTFGTYCVGASSSNSGAPGPSSDILIVKNSHHTDKTKRWSGSRRPAIKLEPAPIMGFPASRADEGPDNQGPPPMPDVEEH